MRTLREIGEFVGIPQDSPEHGAQSAIGLRLVGSLLARGPIGTAEQRNSMQGIDGLLRTLSPISLQVELLTPGGVEPYELMVRLAPSSGLVISTYVSYQQSGQVLYRSQNFGNAGGDFRLRQLAAGQYDVIVQRAGIASDGYRKLQQPFSVTVTRESSEPPPPPPPSPKPHIDVAQSGPANAVKFVVTGDRFLPDQPDGAQGITVRGVDGVNPQNWVMVFTRSGKDGSIALTLGPLDTGTLSRNALGQAIVNFSAADKRKDPDSVPANEPLWSNTVTFYF